MSDNIVLYFNPETEQPIKLLLLSYHRLVETNCISPPSLGLPPPSLGLDCML